MIIMMITLPSRRPPRVAAKCFEEASCSPALLTLPVSAFVFSFVCSCMYLYFYYLSTYFVRICVALPLTGHPSTGASTGSQVGE